MMLRLTAWMVALGLVSTFVTGVQGQDVSPNKTRTLAAKQKWVRFAVVRGRITALAAQGQSILTSSGSFEDGWGERFYLHAQSGSTTVRYENRGADQSVVVHFAGPQDVSIERDAPNATTQRLVFQQRPAKGITLTIGEGAPQNTYHAPSLWHLFLLQPEVCRQQLVPVLEHLRPDWRLNERAAKIELALLSQPLPDTRPPIEAYVEQLADPSFRVRQTADRQLRAMGHSLLPFLESLDQSRLNSEQKVRIAEIRASFHDQAEDSPARVAAWLVNDARIWSSWERSEIVARREAAAQRLAWLKGEPAVVSLAEAPRPDRSIPPPALQR